MKPERRAKWFRILIYSTIGFAVAFLITSSRYHLLVVNGDSMLPTMEHGEIYIVDELKIPEKGDIVEVILPGDSHASVKRVAYDHTDEYVYMSSDISLLSDTFTGRDRPGMIYAFRSKDDGQAIDRDEKLSLLYTKTYLNKGEYILFGDNRNISEDSHIHGIIFIESINGVILQ